MSAIIDPAKLKVVELRAELSARGLDAKGNKPVLVKRLREALEAETGNDLPDTSIAETSTEELDSSNVSLSQSSSPPPPPEFKQPKKETTPEPEVAPPAESPPKSRSRTRKSMEICDKAEQVKSVKETVKEEKMKNELPKSNEEKEIDEQVEKTSIEPIDDRKITEQDQTTIQVQEVLPEVAEEKETEKQTNNVTEVSEIKMDIEESKEVEDEEMIENKISTDSNQDIVEPEKEISEPRNRKSRWGSVTETEPPADSNVQQIIDDNSMTSAAPSGPPSDEPRGEKRRHGSPSPERSARKRSRSPIKEDEPDIDCDKVQLSWIDSDLHLQISKECFTVAEPICNDGFGYMWAGVRSSHGVNNGKVWYEVKLLENCDWKEAPKDENKSKKMKDKEKEEEKTEEEDNEKDEKPAEPLHMFRVGWSLPNTDLQLGEHPWSYGYDSEGFSVTDAQFTEFATKYTTGDVIGTFLNIEPEQVTISYTVNGELQPTAFTVEHSQLPENFVLFPHILTRNVKFEVNFGQNEELWFNPPAEFADYCVLKNVEEKVIGLTRPENRQDCEVIMMVGLPCSGKTHWINDHVTNHPEKRYNVLGLATILDRMKYQGKSRKEHFKGSMTVLMDKCSRCLSKLVDMAATRRRNYILDQTNLFSSAQRRKMRPFDGFRRRAVVIVVTDDEQSAREKSRQQADGKDVADSAVIEMKANMCLPMVCDWLDEVIYAELDEAKAKEIVQKYNKQGREAGYGPNYTAKQHSNNQKPKGSTDRRGSWGRNNKRDSSRENRNRWSGGGGGGGGGHVRPNNWGGNRGSGNWSRHDSRNHHHGGGRGGDYRNASNNRMISGGGGYNRNQGGGPGGGGGYNRNRNQPPHRNQMPNKGGSWGGQGGGNWNSQGSWGNQGAWGGHQSGGQGGSSGSGWYQNNWGQYGNQGQGGGNQQWKGGYNAQQYQQQGYPQGYAAGQYGGQQYANWNYYGQYAQGWNAQGQGSGGGSGDNSNAAQYNQYTQQQQAAWAQYAQTGYGGYGQTSSQGGNAVTGATPTTQAPTTK